MKPLLKVLCYILLPIALILSATGLGDNQSISCICLLICGGLGFFSSDIFPDKK